MDGSIRFRFAGREDIPLILRFIKELADYEGMLDQVVATEELLDQWLWALPCFSIIFPPSWDVRVFIWRIYTCVLSTGTADLGKHF